MEDQEKFGTTDLYMLMAILIWAVNFAFIKIALKEFSPSAFNGIRMAFASIILLLLLLLSRQGFGVQKRDIWKLVALGFIGNTVYQLLFIQGIDLTTASSTAIIMAMTPVSVALLSSLLKHEKIHWAAWVGILLSFAGFYLVITKQPAKFLFDWENLKGDMLIFFGNIVWAVYTVFSKPLLSRITPLKWSSLSLAAGTLFYLPFCIPALSNQDFSRISVHSWGILAFSGLFALAISYIIWYASVKRVGNSKTAIYGNITPVFTVVFAFVLIGERIRFWQVLGALILLTGVYITRSGYRFFLKKVNKKGKFSSAN
jgi:drug/metabolite transporter (DMT)-like permease